MIENKMIDLDEDDITKFCAIYFSTICPRIKNLRNCDDVSIYGTRSIMQFLLNRRMLLKFDHFFAVF